jgi:hypothetical protein
MSQFCLVRSERLEGLKSFREVYEELVSQLLGRAVDQPLPELRQLAADLRFDMIAQQSSAITSVYGHWSRDASWVRTAALRQKLSFR